MRALLVGDLARILALCQAAAENKNRPAAEAGGGSS
jgi:hypothetical protein